MASGFPPVDELVPHRHPALLLTEVEAELTDGIVCIGMVPADHPLAHESGARAILGVELAAQAAAAHEGLHALRESGTEREPKLGYLVSIRTCRLNVPFLVVGKRLRARVRLIGTAGPLSSYTATISRIESAEIDIECRFSAYKLGPRATPSSA
jgi:predicted hotdog family 3-hydroxylacyl-ACP dehydratase